MPLFVEKSIAYLLEWLRSQETLTVMSALTANTPRVSQLGPRCGKVAHCVHRSALLLCVAFTLYGQAKSIEDSTNSFDRLQ